MTRYRIHQNPVVETEDTEKAELAKELGYRVTAQIR